MTLRACLLLLACCQAPEAARPVTPATATAPSDASFDAIPTADEPVVSEEIPPAPAVPPEMWLKGSTHVHARPSGDSSEPIAKVIDWYEAHGYDFIALTDHNRVSELDATSDTHGQVAIRAPEHGLIVLAGTELTHNPSGCLPPGDKSKRCRIHVNVLGPTSRPVGKIDWADRKTHDRLTKYQAALTTAHQLGGTLVQVNHPQWFWGMTRDVLVGLAQRGVRLVEIDNVQFEKWNGGDHDHPSMESLWDEALVAGETLWGVADDDAHSYNGHGTWPAGGGWVVVRARRDAQAILDALAAGHFYASNGVTLSRAEIDGDRLVIEIGADQPGSYTIAFIENGQPVESIVGRSASRMIPESGYVRAVVTRDDGKKAWIQPSRR
jgi:hypothetical protein